MSEFLYRIPNKKLAWKFLAYLDRAAVQNQNQFNFKDCSARDSLYKQLCISEDKDLGWPVQKVAETFPKRKLKKKHIKKFIQ
tara:strand:+ start:309 stop:554 length:246 start_codon:yes stop_codon:yes gene_type:complete